MTSADAVPSLLRHVVLFGFTGNTTAEEIDEIVGRFTWLHNEISNIESFEWGTNNSPENLNRDLTHSFVLTFASSADRDAYLTDPAHIAFAAWVGAWVEHVTVVDYWATVA